MKPFRTISLFLVLIAAHVYVISGWFQDYHDFVAGKETIFARAITRDPPHITRTLDIDGDGEDELYHSFLYGYANTQSVSLFEPLDAYYMPLYYGEILVPSDYMFFGAYYDQASHIYLFRFIDYENGKLVLQDMDNRQNHRRRLTVTGTEKIIHPKTGMAFLIPINVDLDNDGKAELLVIFKQDSLDSQGVILCIDPPTGQSMWNYRMGPVIIDAQCSDLDGDGKKEIVLSTFAALNGARFDTTEDNYSYLVTLDHGGNRLWEKKVGGGRTFTRTVIHDIDSNHRPEIITATQAHAKRERMLGEILVLNGTDGKIKARYSLLNVSFSKPLVHTFGAGTRIYVGDSSGTIRMFDPGLNLLNSVRLKENVQVHALEASTADAHGTGY